MSLTICSVALNGCVTAPKYRGFTASRDLRIHIARTPTIPDCGHRSRRDFTRSLVDGSRKCSMALGRRSVHTAATWLDNSASVVVDVPVESCYDMWSDRTRIPQWMPWIHSVEVQEADEKLSKWVLRTTAFERDWEFAWMAQNLAPIPLQKIHWRSVPGSVQGSLGSGIEVPNRGQIRFVRLSPSQTRVTLTISYELPSALAFVGTGLAPIVERFLMDDMKRFKALAEKELVKSA